MSVSSKEITYKVIEDRELKMTFLPPTNKKYKNAPLYFIIPGGGWHSAIKESMIEFSQISVDMLREKGFAVASIEYRTANDTVKMCDILEDCFDALGYLCANSTQLRIDTSKIVTSGHSAGAHLALMLAYADGNLFTKSYNFTNETAKIIAVAALSPPVVLYEKDYPKTLGFGINDLFKNPADLTERKTASPIEYISASSPPTILFASTSDNLVYHISSELLCDKLIKENVKTKLVICENGGHSFEKVGEREPSISFESIQIMIVDFVMELI